MRGIAYEYEFFDGDIQTAIQLFWIDRPGSNQSTTKSLRGSAPEFAGHLFPQNGGNIPVIFSRQAASAQAIPAKLPPSLKTHKRPPIYRRRIVGMGTLGMAAMARGSRQSQRGGKAEPHKALDHAPACGSAALHAGLLVRFSSPQL